MPDDLVLAIDASRQPNIALRQPRKQIDAPGIRARSNQNPSPSSPSSGSVVERSSVGWGPHARPIEASKNPTLPSPKTGRDEALLPLPQPIRLAVEAGIAHTSVSIAGYLGDVRPNALFRSDYISGGFDG